jgi:hypothetical protein
MTASDPQDARAKLERSRTRLADARGYAERAIERIERCIEMVRRLGKRPDR